jgi:hypothetical protein
MIDSNITRVIENDATTGAKLARLGGICPLCGGNLKVDRCNDGTHIVLCRQGCTTDDICHVVGVEIAACFTRNWLQRGDSRPRRAKFRLRRDGRVEGNPGAGRWRV